MDWCLFSKMTASYEIKWVGICFQGNPAHPDHGTSFGVEAGCVSTCHHTTAADEAAAGRARWLTTQICLSASEVSGNHTNELTSVKRAHNVQETQLNLPRINWNIDIEDWQYAFATLDILFSVFSLKVRQHQKIGSTTTCLLRCNYVLSFLRLVHRDVFLSVPTVRVHTHKQARTHAHTHTHTHTSATQITTFLSLLPAC